MPKLADKYLKLDPWEIIEQGFHPTYGRVSESIFSLGNEYMGIRGSFDEGYSGNKLIGSYLNGVIERDSVIGAIHYKGVINQRTYMVNTVDWLFTRMTMDGETLDLNKSKFRNFVRKLDMKNGVLTREFIWESLSGKEIKITFERFLSMVSPKLGCQRITLKSLNCSGKIQIKSALDFSQIHESEGKNLWTIYKKQRLGSNIGIISKTQNSGQMVLSSFQIHGIPGDRLNLFEEAKVIGVGFTLDLETDKELTFDKMVVNYTEKNPEVNIENVWLQGMNEADKYCSLSYDDAFKSNAEYWEKTWKNSDIVIEGDPENQQGIRYCIFQLYQTYHGEDPSLNIGAKGLTGEAYSGNAFWDTETYCLPFYIFNNPKAARNLVDFRYKTLHQAIERARDLDCDGAFYPIATNDGTECCSLWQHASLQLQASTAVAYAIWDYCRLLDDKEFLYTKGIEMLIQISRMLASRGQWGQETGKYGYYSVMGPDEFKMMVNNNYYTNMMGKKTLQYSLDVLSEMETKSHEQLSKVEKKVNLKKEELTDWKTKSDNMYIPFDENTGLYEQNDGFFNLPHVDIHSIPVSDFPLYNNWSYDRIYRSDMIKQPDVLMYMFLYNQEFSYDIKKINYEYYEPRCIHESSLSPSIHSIFASELGKYDEAFEFFKFATRMDLDNYNRNTNEGLHTTSIAAAWMNIVYGFGGMRSDGHVLEFNPSLPQKWDSYNFKVLYKNALLNIKINKVSIAIKTMNGRSTDVKVYGKNYTIDENGIEIEMSKIA